MIANRGDMQVDEVKEPATFSPASVYDTVLRLSAIQNHGVLAKSTHSPDVVYDHDSLPTLSLEELERLDVNRPNTFAEASQISGITTQVYLYHHIQRRNRQTNNATANQLEPSRSNKLESRRSEM
jgi:hypothetical protein